MKHALEVVDPIGKGGSNGEREGRWRWRSRSTAAGSPIDESCRRVQGGRAGQPRRKHVIEDGLSGKRVEGYRVESCPIEIDQVTRMNGDVRYVESVQRGERREVFAANRDVPRLLGIGRGGNRGDCAQSRGCEGHRQSERAS